MFLPLSYVRDKIIVNYNTFSSLLIFSLSMHLILLIYRFVYAERKNSAAISLGLLVLISSCRRWYSFGFRPGSQSDTDNRQHLSVENGRDAFQIDGWDVMATAGIKPFPYHIRFGGFLRYSHEKRSLCIDRNYLQGH